ncbi:MAG TPA: alginate export family protein [Lacunisphaera sp.]|nr:alginate export family protein [Lacunisphaera sp.]
MKTLLHAALAISLAGALSAQTAVPAPKPAPPPFPGYINSQLRASDPALKAWDVSVNVRLRYDDKDGAGTTDAGSNWDFSRRPVDDNQNAYELLRLMPKIAYTGQRVSFVVEGRTSYTFGDERYSPTAPGHNLPEDDGVLDVYQAYAQFGTAKDPVSFKIGRQELTYGDQRLVGHARWLNVPRTFDAAKLHFEQPEASLDLFTSAVVYVRDHKLNTSNQQDMFSGAYLTLPKVSAKELVELYFYSRNVARGILTDTWSDVAAPARLPAPQDLYTLGVRIKSKPNARGPWDYTLEGAWQGGNRTAVFPGTAVAAALAAPRLNQNAYTVIAQLGYTPADMAWSPRFAATLSQASGDNNPTDGKSGTFQNLFPSNHLLYGAFDLTGLQNARDLRLSVSSKPLPKVTLGLEVNYQWLENANDFWYNAAGAPRNFTGAAAGSGGGFRINPGYDRDLGHEIDLLASWAFMRGASLDAAVCHYYRGDYVKESLRAVGSKDATYAYVQLTVGL